MYTERGTSGISPLQARQNQELTGFFVENFARIFEHCRSAQNRANTMRLEAQMGVQAGGLENVPASAGPRVFSRLARG